MLNVQKVNKLQFEKIMKKRRIRTYIAAVLIIIFSMYIIGFKCYEYAISKSYCKYLINMDAGNFDIEKIRMKRQEYEEKMDIQNIDYKMDDNLEKDNNPKVLVIHHTAADNLEPEKINEDHKARGYGGIGYHFYIRKDGTIYRGRGEEYTGAHTIGRNHDSLGICLEGNFETETLEEKQKEALIMLCADMVVKYNISDIIGHRDAYETLCPGENISIDDLKDEVKNEIMGISK